MTGLTGLPLPRIDDRRWADLVEDALTLVPVVAPEWTDHNLHDPGITLLEALAALVEQQIFRLDRIGDAQLEAFLKLAGATPRPARPARVAVGLTLPPGLSLPLTAGTSFTARAGDGSPVPFRTRTALTARGVGATAVITCTDGVWADRTPALARGEAVALFGNNPHAGDSFALAFEAEPPAGDLTLYFTVRDGGESDTQRELLREDPAALGVNLAWEARGPGGAWEEVRAADDTRALTLNGAIVLALPAGMTAGVLSPKESPRWHVRGRIASGRPDAPMRLRSVLANGVEVEQRAALPAETVPHPLDPLPPGEPATFQRLTGGDGWPDQVRTIAGAPVDAATVRVFTHEDGRWMAWTVRDSFRASGRRDAHATLDAASGALTFGDGERGRVLPRGASLYVAALGTRGAAGNVAAHAFPPDILQPHAARGGADAETLETATARLRRRTEETAAVTLADILALAKTVPGTRVAAAFAAANVHPDLPGVPAPGVVTVVVLPELPAGRPEPTPALRATVCRYLNRRTLVGTCIEVIGPRYRRVSAAAKVDATAAGFALLSPRLNRFFDPLTGGPDGTGWPVGRTVYRSEVLAALLAVSGVRAVRDLTLALDDVEPGCDNLCLGPFDLPTSGTHTFIAGGAA